MADKFANIEPALAAMKQSATYLTMRQALPLLPMKVTTAAPLRWAREGVHCRNGSRVYLKHIRMGGRILTRADWVQEFFDEQVAANVSERPAAPSPTPDQQPRKSRYSMGGVFIRSHAEADARLTAKGM